MTSFNFGNIKKIILLGGSEILPKIANLFTSNNIEVIVFSSKRHLEEKFNNVSLKEILIKNQIKYFESVNINKDENIKKVITENTIALSLGAAWILKKEFIDLFNGKLVNLHGARLPQNRGCAGISWQIMRKNKLGFCLLHKVDEGVDTGEIIKYKEFIYPAECKTPLDFHNYYFEQNLIFLKDFINEIKQNKSFTLICQPEYLSTYWPRLYTEKHGYINWDWKLEDLETFINAFDSPYQGASTFINEKRVFLKNCLADYNDGSFHPFQTGIVYRKNDDMLFVCAQTGTLIVREIVDKNGANKINEIQVGDRFYTPIDLLEKAKQYRAIYTPSGIKE